jgi:anti-sigma B factor antagonist
VRDASTSSTVRRRRAQSWRRWSDAVSGFSIDVRAAAANALVVTLRGELDLNSAYTLNDELRRLELDRPDLLVLDLRLLTFMDCAGLGRLVALRRRAERQGFRLVLVRGTKIVQRLLAVTALDVTFEQVAEPGDVLLTV